MLDQLNLNRRAMLAQIAVVLGTSALPASALAAPRGKAKHFLPKRQFSLLGAVVDTIMPATDTPGALAAGVPARLDGLLANWAAPATRTSIVEALARIDAAALAQKQKGFAALSAADREAVLRPHDKAALEKVPPPANAPKGLVFMQPSYVADQGYLKIKDLVVNLYYYSEIATQTELPYVHVPGQWQPSIKLTVDSRPELGVGPF